MDKQPTQTVNCSPEHIKSLREKVSARARKEIDALLIDLYARLHSAKGSLDEVVEQFEGTQKVRDFLKSNPEAACEYLRSGMEDLLTCFEMIRAECGE